LPFRLKISKSFFSTRPGPLLIGVVLMATHKDFKCFPFAKKALRAGTLKNVITDAGRCCAGHGAPRLQRIARRPTALFWVVPKRSANGVNRSFNSTGEVLMWLVTQHGFFNIVHSDSDSDDILTMKARRKEDLVNLKKFILFKKIDESKSADYQFRAKARRIDIEGGIQKIISLIDYPKFKSRIHEVQPDRSDIYMNVWCDLSQLQNGLDADYRSMTPTTVSS
jgi:hypothetical protein